MNFTDTHAHLYKEYYENFDIILANAQKNHVNKIINAATNFTNIDEVLKMANNYENVFACIGIHPEDLNDHYHDLENIIKANIDNKKIVAIGEIGLDYYYTKETKEQQIKLFEYQLFLAEKYQLPVVVHSREATLDTINCLKKYNVKGVIHCFSGSIETANIYIKMGFYIGVGGVMTFKNAKIDKVIKEIPLEYLVLETDSPYLTPEPYRKYSNEPKYIYEIANYLAKLKNISLEEVSNITEENVEKIFNIKFM